MMYYLQKGLRVGDNIAIREVGGDSIRYFKILNRDTIFLVDSHSALAASGTEDYTEYTNLDPPIDQLYQIYKIELAEGNVDVFIKQPAVTNSWGTNRSPTGGFLDDEHDTAIVNIWITEDYPPATKLVNNTNVSVTAKIRWWGWKYLLKKLVLKKDGAGEDIPPQTFTPINVGGIAR